MNRLKSGILVVFFFLSLACFAQKMDKKEKKALQKEIKALKKNLGNYKIMRTELSDLNSQVSSKESEVSSQGSQLTDLKTEIEDKDRAIANLLARVKELKKKKTEINVANIEGRFEEGATLFTIQIGSYVNTDLSNYMEKDVNFRVETFQNESDGKSYKRYLVGFFQGNPKGYWEAKHFANFLSKNMKVNGDKFKPFVVGYKNGKFIEDIIKEMSEYFL